MAQALKKETALDRGGSQKSPRETNAEEGGGSEEAQSPYHHGHLTRMRHVIVYMPLSTTRAASAKASSTHCPAVTGAS